MSSHGYIYVRNWERFQHYKNRRPAWIKLYLDLFNDDEYLDLTPSDRCLLQACWMAAAESGNGRCRADQSTLRARSKSPKGSLKRLSDAGFIEIRASKALADVLATEQEVEVEQEQEEPSTPIPSSEPAANGGAPTTALPHALLRILDDRIPPQLKPGQVALATQAWEYNDVEIRHSLAAVEAADNPTAYFVSVCRRILPSKEPIEAKPRSSVTWPKGIPAA